MKVRVLALDYDGTIASAGALDPDVRAAHKEARSRGIVVVIVTGRMLDDFRAVAGGLQLADAVVAENGAVVAFSACESRSFRLAPSPRLSWSRTFERVAFTSTPANRLRTALRLLGESKLGASNHEGHWRKLIGALPIDEAVILSDSDHPTDTPTVFRLAERLNCLRRRETDAHRYRA